MRPFALWKLHAQNLSDFLLTQVLFLLRYICCLVLASLFLSSSFHCGAYQSLVFMLSINAFIDQVQSKQLLIGLKYSANFAHMSVHVALWYLEVAVFLWLKVHFALLVATLFLIFQSTYQLNLRNVNSEFLTSWFTARKTLYLSWTTAWSSPH